MTEAEWQTSSNPSLLLQYVAKSATERKLRLVVLECRARVRDLMVYRPYRSAVVVAERYVEGAANATELSRASRAALSAATQIKLLGPVGMFRRRLAWSAVRAAVADASSLGWKVGEAVDAATNAKHVLRPLPVGRVLRCVFGNPFRPVTFSPPWLNPTAVAIATVIYEDRAFDRLPILADALQDAGCEDEAILGHCRGDGVHVRGCWVVDGVLGKG
ncbi:hypothetical protein [Limnoglobus roseus]|uniref:SMI1/KNR4 family protein n=1 Tax=Limnoglobus roseus TaxID=2598579 RepID=A0A5C1AN11_9BACT|nr:hypothetical protein [Limnoglobus roseus]QEL20621.1 hypothetical protein PX52LOC_07726 [Limnoglobus roseus]